MNKYTYLIVFLLFVKNTNAKLDLERPKSKPNQELSIVKSFIRSTSDFMGTENLGYQALTQENENFIRSIAHDLEMDDYCIEIRGMSNRAQREIGRLNAFVIPSQIFSKKSHAYLYISEDWFDSLTLPEKQGIVRHELMHLRQNHLHKIKMFSIASFLGFCLVNHIIQHNFEHSQSTLSSILYELSPVFLSCAWFLSFLKYIKSCEKEADIEAAKSMDDKQGMVNLFITMKEGIEDPDSQFIVKRLISKLFKSIEKLLSTHPTFDERISYIQNLS